jgi:hypothetical protein
LSCDFFMYQGSNRLWAGQLGFVSWWEQDYFFYTPQHPDSSGAHPVSCPAGTMGSYLMGKVAGTRSWPPSSSTEVKKSELCFHTPYSFMAWCSIKHRDNFTFIFYLVHDVQILSLVVYFNIYFWCLHPVVFVYKCYFILLSPQQFYFLFIMLYSALHILTTVDHLQVLQFLYTIIKL